jgi:hypothetical protein
MLAVLAFNWSATRYGIARPTPAGIARKQGPGGGCRKAGILRVTGASPRLSGQPSGLSHRREEIVRNARFDVPKPGPGSRDRRHRTEIDPDAVAEQPPTITWRRKRVGGAAPFGTISTTT